MSIKQTAGKILLALYMVQIENPAKLERTQIVFQSISKSKLETKSWLKDILHGISDNDALLHNGFNYLLENGLITDKNSNNPVGVLVLIGLHLTGKGIDVVEGVEQGPEQQKVVKALFSFNFSSNVTVDSLVKAEIGSLAGIGVAASGRIGL